MPSLFTKKYQRRQSRGLSPLHLRQFTGGLNVVDDEDILAPRFSPVLKNFYRGTDGSQILRYGSQWYADVASHVTGSIVDMDFHNARIIAVTDTGHVAGVDMNGAVTALWNSTIASALPGSPGAWSSGLDFVSFVRFKRDLIIHNGVDKPITIDWLYDARYLQDLASGSNVNVPIGKYGCVVGSYHCVAGIPGEPTLVVISMRRAAGTFVGDVDSDAIELQVNGFVPEDAGEITGIAGYRDNLIVFFRGAAALFKLGEYVDEIHTPVFSDTMPNFGLVSQRSIVTIDNDILFASQLGISSAKRNLMAGLIESRPLSDLVSPLYLTNALGSPDEVEHFAIHNQISGKGLQQLLYFGPEGQCLVWTFNTELKIKAWSEYIGWDWIESAAQSIYGRVFLSDGSKIFLHGNGIFPGENYYADRLLDRDFVWANSTAYTVGQLVYDAVTNEVFRPLINHTSAASGTFLMDREANPEHWEQYLGEPIDFDWETPWVDANDPERVKHSKYIKVGSKGTAGFLCDVYTDGYYKDELGVVEHDPALSLPMVGNQHPQFGQGQPDETFGGGRRSNYPRLYGFPVKFKRLKFRFHGATRSPLRLLWINLLLKTGSYMR